MFKNLISFWKGRDFIKEALGEFSEMMQDTEDIFKSVCNLLIRGQTKEGLKDNIYKVDKQVNELERDIRKRVIEHLSIQPGVDVPFSLVLMSVVKDAERLGDYSKNLFEVWEFLKRPLDQDLYKRHFNGLDQKLFIEYEKTRQAFLESDEKLAYEILDLEREIVKMCDKIVEDLARSNLEANEAVCLTLIARYFKRVAAHLGNIGSSVILPITDLDFFDEKLRHGKT